MPNDLDWEIALDLLGGVSGGADDDDGIDPNGPDTSCDSDTCVTWDGGAEYWEDW